MKEIDRKVETEILAEELERMLKESPQSDGARFVQKLLEAGPEIGGLLGAVTGASGVGGALVAAAAAVPGLLNSVQRDKEQAAALRLLLLLARNSSFRLDDAERRLVHAESQDQLVAVRVSFDPNAGSIAVGKSKNVTSVTDNGHLDFTINFTAPIWPYTFLYLGTGQVHVVDSVATAESLRVRLAERAPDRVTVLIVPE